MLLQDLLGVEDEYKAVLNRIQGLVWMRCFGQDTHALFARVP